MSRVPARGSVAARPASTPEAAGQTSLWRVGAGTHAAFEASLEFFLSPLVPLLRDPEVTEIMVNGPEKIYVERAGRLTLTNARFATEADVQAAANNIAQFVGQPLTADRPMLDGRLPDGSRICIVLGQVAAAGTHINIRRFARNTATPAFLLERKSVSPMAMEFLMLAVKGFRNIVVAGGAGSGKTTVVNVLTNAFAEDERIVVIEDTRELQMQRPHVVQMEARPADIYGRGLVTVRDLFVTSLRMRPDRIVVGEVRRGEALDMIQALTSGHHGSMTTVHASSPADTCYRLETLALMADVGIPLQALRRQIAGAIDLVVQTSRLRLRPPPDNWHRRGRIRRSHPELSDRGHFPPCRHHGGERIGVDPHPAGHFGATPHRRTYWPDGPFKADAGSVG